MEFPPIDFSPEHQLWVDHCLARLEVAFEQSLQSLDSGELTNGSTIESKVEAQRNAPLAANDQQDPFHAGPCPIHLKWQEPDEWLPTILLAERLLNFEKEHQQQWLALQVSARALLQESLSTLGNWLYQLVRTSHATFEDEAARFVQLLAAQKASECYVVFRKYKPQKCLGLFLQSMLLSGHSVTVKLAVDLLVEQPPEEWTDVAQALAVLMQSNQWKTDDVFPRIFETTNPSVLAPAFDLANMLVRKQGLAPHPAKEKLDTFLNLFGAVTQQLLSLEENPRKFSDNVAVVQRILFDSVSLLVSMCDAFALIGDSKAIGKLNQAVELKHRRIKLEAAYGLAKLGENRAIDLLVELLQDDSSRGRAVAYLQELSAEERIAPEWTTSLAKAKSDLALWLSQPEQFAIPPTRIELVEQRTIPWPGFEGPQECFLLQFEYGMGENTYSNVGFSGPFACALSLDLKSLNNDSLFAIFLGNDVDDPTESRIAWDSLSEPAKQQLRPWIDDLEDKGFHQIEPIAKLLCLGHESVLCRAMSDETTGWGVLTDGLSVVRCPAGPQTFETLFLQWKGRLAFEILGES